MEPKSYPEMEVESGSSDKSTQILERLTAIEQLLTLLVNSQLEESKQVVETGDNKYKLKTKIFSSKDLILALERKANNAAHLPKSAEDIKL